MEYYSTMKRTKFQHRLQHVATGKTTVTKDHTAHDPMDMKCAGRANPWRSGWRFHELEKGEWQGLPVGTGFLSGTI